MNLYNSSEITVHKLNELREEDKKIQILDVREDTERDHAHIKGTIHIKLSEIANRYTELDGDKNIFVMCHTGTRSQAVCKWLKSKGKFGGQHKVPRLANHRKYVDEILDFSGGVAQ